MQNQINQYRKISTLFSELQVGIEIFKPVGFLFLFLDHAVATLCLDIMGTEVPGEKKHLYPEYPLMRAIGVN